MDATLDLLLRDTSQMVKLVDVGQRAGVSRQTVYDHFSTRTDLLIAAILHFGNRLDIEGRLAPSRAATDGAARLRAYTQAILEFYPAIYPLQQALTRLGEDDQEAKAAWGHRLDALKEGCDAAIGMLADDGALNPAYSLKEACDYYFSLLSLEAWAYCVQRAGWTEDRYLDQVQTVTQQLFVRDPRG
ncbi:TetR/AcrR family transcriptional regulator [Cognatishimia sp. SS12]|uniref:TetR/AcrR family transcriptional regulator n=1 Tax=Cognatishimia sp. SS12 TaxID=2979465 RepID=UPI0023307E09|nr:TetR/AcrR family transcriptional regulator [Cognatishimia sp. SS12]